MSDNFKNLHLQLSVEDIERIDEWKRNNGMKSRSEAIRHIIKTAYEKTNSNIMAESGSDEFLKPKGNKNIEKMIRNVVKEEINKLK